MNKEFISIWNVAITVLTMLIGKIDKLLIALLIFITLDYITGIACAWKNKELNSAVGYSGLIRKGVILTYVIVGNVIDVMVLGNGTVFRTCVIIFYLSNEGISLLENGSKLGVPFPEKIKDVLIQLRKED